MKNTQGKNLRSYALLYGAVAIYSCSGICSKIASSYPMLSLQFVLFYGMSVCVLGAYAVIWQSVLRRFDLAVAYTAKPFSIILSMIFGVVLFHEELTWNMVAGAALILLGMRTVMQDHE